jgi:hypothetical protein
MGNSPNSDRDLGAPTASFTLCGPLRARGEGGPSPHPRDRLPRNTFSARVFAFRQHYEAAATEVGSSQHISRFGVGACDYTNPRSIVPQERAQRQANGIAARCGGVSWRFGGLAAALPRIACTLGSIDVYSA